MIISPEVFFFFSKFWFLGYRGVKGQKTVQNVKKFCLLHSISQEPYVIWLSYMVHIRKMIISSGVFIVFSKFWFSGSIRGVKGQKMVQNDKKLCLLCSISLEPYIIWLSFMVQMCKMIISPGVFFNVKILVFQVVKGLKGQKMSLNDENFSLAPYISGTIYHIIFIYGTHVCVKG